MVSVSSGDSIRLLFVFLGNDLLAYAFSSSIQVLNEYNSDMLIWKCDPETSFLVKNFLECEFVIDFMILDCN